MAGLMLTLRANFAHLPVAALEQRRTPVETAETPVETPVELGGAPVETVKTPVKTPDRIVELLRANPQRILAEVAEEIGRSRRAVERATARLVDAGRLRFIGPRKGGHWEVLK